MSYINREEAIRLIMEYQGGAMDKPTAKKVLEGMDGVEICEDTVSRQAAIDAVEHITSSMSVCVNTDECHGMKRMQRQAVIELANLPPAQPERAVKDCRNCKHGKYNDYHDTYFCYNPEDCSNWDKWETSAQRKGKWIKVREASKTYPNGDTVFIEYDEYKCSICGMGYPIDFTDEINYCPNCGADMRGEEDDTV